jgi:hypothetical protein
MTLNRSRVFEYLIPKSLNFDISFYLYFVADVEGTLTSEIETPNSDCSPEHQLPLGNLSSFSASPSGSQERGSNDEGTF